LSFANSAKSAQLDKQAASFPRLFAARSKANQMTTARRIYTAGLASIGPQAKHANVTSTNALAVEAIRRK
jgi:hypothetical protein